MLAATSILASSKSTRPLQISRLERSKKVSETKEEVSRWKQQRDARKLNDRADRAEAYAVDSVDYGIAVIEEAKDAVLEAVAARLDADAAQ
jgi:hypothetical protein